MRRLGGGLFAFGVLAAIPPGFAAQGQTPPVVVLRGATIAGQPAPQTKTAANAESSAPTILRGAPSPPPGWEPAAGPPCPEGAGYLPGYGCVVPSPPGYPGYYQSAYYEPGYFLPNLPVLAVAPGFRYRHARRGALLGHRKRGHRTRPFAARRGVPVSGVPRTAIGIPPLHWGGSGHWGMRGR